MPQLYSSKEMMKLFRFSPTYLAQPLWQAIIFIDLAKGDLISEVWSKNNFIVALLSYQKPEMFGQNCSNCWVLEFVKNI